MLSGKKTLSESDHQTLTKCDRCVLNLLRLHFIKTEPSDLECRQIYQLLQPFQAALAQKSIISLMPDGQVNFMTQQAERLIKQYFSSHNAEILPDSLQHWFKHQVSCTALNDDRDEIQVSFSPLHIEQAEKQLIIHFIPGIDRKCYLLLLEEQALPSLSVETLELLGLTRREAEVLYLIATDKSNAGIARELDCCEGTVRKHLENVYKKLGVQTRTAALMVALERLGLLKIGLVARSL